MAVLNEAVSGSVDYMDLIGAGIVKKFGEQALAPMIGNGNLKSGLIKLAIGFGARKFLGKGTIGDSLSLGMSVDGVEDILTQFVGGSVDSTGDDW
ncbi:MAG: hypothetical protein SYNGOMJ08_00379 [Candidatus Syntrophoarchaeum sp. GoM_oil]|nr:MAG: hypothetical protein SYNGOMJ08_00379 [Candidatus Syntrophoarchaeum sp. GoM_oil]